MWKLFMLNKNNKWIDSIGASRIRLQRAKATIDMRLIDII